MVAGKPVIDGRINGVPARIMIDAGDRSARSVLWRFRRHPAIDALYAGRRARVTGYGAGGPVMARLARAARLPLAPDIELREIISPAPTARGGLHALPETDASIGNEALRELTVVFGYPHRAA